MRRLLAADWVRFGRRRDLRVLVVLLPVILAAMFVAEFNSLTTPPNFFNIVSDPPDPVAEAEMRDQILAEWHARVETELPAFAFPASLLKVAGNLGPPVLLAIYLSTALVAGEFEWGTVRTVHLTSRRGRTLAVRAAVVIGLMAIVIGIGLLFAALIPPGTGLRRHDGPVPGRAGPGLVGRPGDAAGDPPAVRRDPDR